MGGDAGQVVGGGGGGDNYPLSTRPLLVGIDRVVSGSPVMLLTINRDTDGTVTEPGFITSVTDAYGRGVYYQSAIFNNTYIPYGYKQSGRELTQVSQLVETGTVNPPMRYQYAYTNILNGEGDETVPLLSGITVPSPTGTGTETATISYAPYTSYVAELTDANGVKLEFTPVNADGTTYTPGSGTPPPTGGGGSGVVTDPGGTGVEPEILLNQDEYYGVLGQDGKFRPSRNMLIPTNLTRVRVKDAQGNVVYQYTANFDGNMNSKGFLDAAGTSFGTATYGSAVNPLKPTQFTDAMNRVWSYTWDRYGNLLTSQTPRGLVTTYTYDYAQFPMGRLVSVQEGTKPATTVAYYEPSGLVSAVTSPAPAGSGVSTVQTSATYSALGNLLSITVPGNNAAATQTVTLGYTQDGAYSQAEALGLPVVITDQLGNKTHLRYDSRGNSLSEADALGNTVTCVYNIADQVLTTLFPATGQTGAGNGKTTAEYQYVGGPQSVSKVFNESLALIRQVSYAYGKEGEVLSVAGNTPEPVAYVYDAMYRANTLTDGNGNVTTWGYNNKGYLASVVYPGGDTVSYTAYNNAAELTSMTDPRGVVSNFTYADPDGELTAITYPAYPAQNVTYSYDTYGRLFVREDEAGTETYAYGDLDEPTQKTTTYFGLTGKTIGRAYFPDGSLKTLSTPAGSFGYLYDGGGRLTSLTNPFGETTVYAYQNNDWLSGKTLANGVGSGFGYNALGQLTALTNALGGSTLSSFTGMTYDGAGNRLGVTASVPAMPSLSGATSYAHDAKDRLTQESSTRAGGFTNNYAYDGAGNPTTFKGQARSYNAKNQLTGGAGLAGGFAYDGDGNPTTYNGAAVTFDVNGCMTSFGTAMTAGYDSGGLRAWKQNTATGQRTYFLYAGVAPVCELDSVGNVVATNTWGPGGLVSRRSGGSSVLYTFDERGNTVQRTDGAGAVLSSRLNDAYGTPGGSATTGDPYDGFGGQVGYYSDAETGLQLCTFRYYDPNTGRWINRDPIGYVGGVNLYSYVTNNPVLFVDPLGLQQQHKDCKHAKIPPAPKGADLIANIKRAEAAASIGLSIKDTFTWFYHRVDDNKEWDYKRSGGKYNAKYEAFGNFNYGATGTALGISPKVLKRAAGWAQQKDKTTRPEWGTWDGPYPYGDQPEDQKWIEEGIKYYKEHKKEF